MSTNTAIAPTARTIEMLHHPDALMPDVPAKVRVDLSSFQPLAGPLKILQQSGQSVILGSADGGRLSLTCCAAGILRLRIDPPGAQPAPTTTEQLGLVQVPADTVPTHIEHDPQQLSFAGGGLCCTVNLATADFQITSAAGTVLLQSRGGGMRFSSQSADYSGHRFHGDFVLDPDERFFGFGGTIMPPNRTGHFADMFAVKAGAFSGNYGGFPIPFFLSTKGYGVFVNNPWPHLYFDLGRARTDQWFVHAPGGQCDIFVFDGPEFADIVGRFTRLVGRLPAPRRWWMGMWCGSLSLARVSEVLAACEGFRKAGLPVDVVQIDGNWRGGPEFLERYMIDGAYTSADFNWHPQFGDGAGMVQKLRAMGIRTVLHVNSRPFSEKTTAQGVAENWLRRQGHEVVVRVGDPAAEARYRQLIAGRNAEKIGCWLQDHGDRVSGEVLPGIPSRNLFGALWARATTRDGSETDDPSPIVFTRGAGIGGQRHCIVWSGDTRVGIDFFEQDIWFLLNAGLSGFPLASCDLGGFMCVKTQYAPHNQHFDRDNLARRVCQSLFFMPTPRTQDDAKEPPKFPWNCPADIERLYGQMLHLRYRMIPYHYSWLVHASKTGEPIMRPMVYHHRHDRVCWAINDQFYLGPWLLVAPVMRKGDEHRIVYLPEGRWINFWTGAQHQGPCPVMVPAPLCELHGLPVFVKAGAILPSQAPVDRLVDQPPAELCLDIYPDGQSQFVLHDSSTLASLIRCQQLPQRVEINIDNALPQPRQFHLRIHGAAPDTALVVNGKTQATTTAKDGRCLEATATIPPRVQ